MLHRTIGPAWFHKLTRVFARPVLVWTMWGILRQNAEIQRFYMHLEVPTTRLEVPEFQGFRLPADLPDKCCTAKN